MNNIWGFRLPFTESKAVENEMEEELQSRFNPPPTPQRSSAQGSFNFRDLLLLGPPANFRPYNLDLDLPDAKVEPPVKVKPTPSERRKSRLSVSVPAGGKSGVNARRRSKMLPKSSTLDDKVGCRNR